MDRLFDETFPSEDGSVVSRNLWYGYFELYVEGEYGKQIILNDELLMQISELVKGDSAEKVELSPTEINWYLYGDTKATDAIGDTIRPTIMIRRKQNGFVVRCNMSDHDFAVNIDTILAFEKNLENILMKG